MTEMPKMKIRILNGPKASDFFQLEKALHIGSSSGCELRILSPYVCAVHARIDPSYDGRWRLRHISKNSKTKLNGVEVGEAPLNIGDVILIGRTQLQVMNTDAADLAKGLQSKNQAWNQKLQQLQSISQTKYPVLLLGPSGSGKDFVANEIHKMSPRSKFKFVSVNCGALNENLIESELFGHKKGSFTGATSDRPGAFETANGGTLFLDEIGDMPLTSQAKLLRALENKEIKAIGSDQNVSVDVRVLAATHKDLFVMSEQGQFRKDLLYRLNVIQLKVPSLAERKEDLSDFLNHFAKEEKVQLSDTALMLLENHQWPGNIREIKNFFARACSLYPGLLITEDRVPHLIDSVLPQQNSYTNQTAAPESTGIHFLKELEREMILERLKCNGWNQRQTASELGIAKSTLHDRIKRYGLIKDNFR